MIRFAALTTCFALTAATTAIAGDHSAAAVQTSDAGYLTDAHGMTLYSFDKDADGQSNCYGGCAQKWPPLVVEAGTDLPDGASLLTRTDGSQQVAFDGKPLYLWVNDTAPGQTSGDGVGGDWHIVKP